MKEQPCIHNDGLHQWYLTGGKKKVVIMAETLGHGPKKYIGTKTEEESKCDNCGDTRWK